MKKLLSLVAALMMVFSLAMAEEAAVYVSVTDDTGALVMAYEQVIVTDADEDGTLTIADALSCAHALQHENGEEAFAAETTEYGLSMTRLWGVENGGSYGYCVNNASAMSLLDPVQAGDHVKAYVYTDLTAWSDTYCYFDADEMTVKAGEEVPLTLTANGYDASYAPITLPVAGAVITANGELVEGETDEQGQIVLIFEEAGTYLLSAQSETMTLVAPVCMVTVE